MKKGISLIVLVITIIVMIILAGAIILSLSSTNVNEQAKWATLCNDYASYQDAVTLKIADDMAGNNGTRSAELDTGAELKEACNIPVGWTVSDAGQVTYTQAAATAVAKPASVTTTPSWYQPAP